VIAYTSGDEDAMPLLVTWQVAAAGSVDERRVGAGEVSSDSAAGQVGLPGVDRRAAHPHMNNLVYGRRSDPAVSSHPDDELSGATCRQIINRCARWQRQLASKRKWNY